MKRSTVIILGVVIAAILLFPILPSVLQRGGGGVLQQEYDRIKAQGEPLTFEELDSWYVRPADNAADVYLRAFDAYVEPLPGFQAKLPWEGKGALPPEGQPLPEVTRQAIQEYVRLNTRSLALLREAAAHPQCRYPIDLRKGPAAELEHLAKIRSSARLLGDQALLLADTGNTDGAVESLIEIFALASSLQNEPILISHLVRFACAQIGIDALTRVARRISPNDAQSAKLSNALDPFINESIVWRAYVGERSILIGCWDKRMGPGFDATFGNLPPNAREGVDMNALKSHIQDAAFQNDLAYLLHIMDLVIQGLKLPPEEGQGFLQQASKLADEAPPDYLITKHYLDMLRGSTGARDRIMEASRTAAATLRAKRH